MNVRVGRLACGVALTITASCGGMASTGPAQPAPAASPPAQDEAGAPVPPSARPLNELDALEHDLAISEHRLEQQLERVAARGPTAGSTTADVRPVPEPARPSTPAPPPPASPASPTEPSGVRLEVKIGSPCDLACRSLQSMKRAAAGICRIAGDGHPRCRVARSRVGEASARVATAGCACF